MEIKCSEMSRKFFFAAMAFLFFLTINSFAFASHETDEINQVIKQKKARWLAGETSVSKLSKEERKNLLGSFLPDITEAAPSNAAESYTASEIVSVPVAFDWRNYNGGNFVTPVRNQSNCGSCWAFATTAALESQELIINNTPGINLDLSEQMLVCCSNSGSCSGGYVNTSSDYIRDTGLPTEDCCPYTATNASCNLTPTCTNGCIDLYTITGWHWITRSVETLKSELCTYGPLIVGMRVYRDFFSYQSGIYSYVKGPYKGDHAILLVGYNDAGQYFIVKNSWGTGWGESGYFRIAYSDVTSVVNFGYSGIAYEK
jgi:C1A family cysteine protease